MTLIKCVVHSVCIGLLEEMYFRWLLFHFTSSAITHSRLLLVVSIVSTITPTINFLFFSCGYFSKVHLTVGSMRSLGPLLSRLLSRIPVVSSVHEDATVALVAFSISTVCC